MEFTGQQRQAVDIHDRNLVVVAGAGSGKTRVLVERYLALLEAHEDWPLNALVAITFTKKAAQEMRDRVREGLEKRVYGATSESDVQRWTKLLGQMDSARIDTIHGLCATLLRANAAEAGIDPDFTVLDETESALLLEDTVDSVLSRLAETGDTTLELFEEYSGQDIYKALTSPDLLAAAPDNLPLDLIDQWHAAWMDTIPDHLSRFLRHVETIGTYEPASNDRLGDIWADCLTCLKYIDHHDSQIALEAFNKIAEITVGNVGSQDNWGDVETRNAARSALMAIRDAAKEIRKDIGDPPNELDERAAHLLPRWASLLRRVRNAYREAKARQGVLDFNDLELLTQGLLTNHAHVRARYQGTEFKHLLVDEFQDTNQAQWEIVQALANPESPGSVFIVGDQKQSIYAFRGADVSVFGDVRAQITGLDGKELPLSISFRTHKPLIDCFNHLFSKLLSRDENSPVARYQVELGEAMEAAREEPPCDETPLDLILIDAFERDEAGQPMTNDRLDASERRRWEAIEIARRLRAMKEGGREIYDREAEQIRPMQYGDVAILLQSLNNVTIYEEAFKAMDIPFVTVAGRGYYNRQEVWDVLNLLRAVHNPADDLSLASALRSPMFGLSDDALLALRLQTGLDDGQPIPLWQALTDPGELVPAGEVERVLFARDTLNALHVIAGRVTISELLRETLQLTGYLAVLTGLPDGARRRGNVEKLIEKAQSSGKVTLGAFSRYLRDLSAREVREGEAPTDVSDVVQIMTVHASKGLEFPVVVLADTSWERGSGNRDPVIRDPTFGLACKVFDREQHKLAAPFSYRRASQLDQLRDEAERLRLLYVAATRAQDYLIISGQVTEKNGTWNSKGWLGRLLEALELEDDLKPCEDFTRTYTWGNARITLPREIHYMESLSLAGENLTHSWESPSRQVEPMMPSLLHDIPPFPETRVRHLAATHIADLGSVEQANNDQDQAFYRERIRRQILQDAPAVIRPVGDSKQRVFAYQVGEIVHEALRHWRLPGGEDDATLRDMLYVYAWRQGITDERLSHEATQRAYRLLQRFKFSDVCTWINKAATAYREVPFVYERQGHIIHGIIDALIQTADGRWVIIDYKTSTVSGVDRIDAQVLANHARRYHLQLAIYAEAAQNQLGGIVPETYIHYVRYTQTVRVHEDEWHDVLSRNLNDRILEVIEDGS